MDQEEKKMIEIENGGVSKKIDAITFVSLMDLIPNSIYKKLDGQEVVELLEIFRKQKQNGKDEIYRKYYTEMQLGIVAVKQIKKSKLSYARVQYTVKFQNENGIVSVLDTFETYVEAVMFIERTNDFVMGAGKYFIIFAEYDEDGNKICSGIAN